MALCKLCTKFDIQSFDGHYRGYLLRNVFDGCRSGCEFCSLLLEHMSSSDKSFPIEPYEFTKAIQSSERYSVSLGEIQSLSRVLDFNPQWVHFEAKRKRCFDRECPYPDSLHITGLSIHISRWHPTFNRLGRDHISGLRAIFNADIGPSTRLHLSADTETPAHDSHDVTGQLSVADNTLFDENFRLIHRWHEKCRSSHPDCNKTLSQSQSINVEQAPLLARCIEVLLENGNLSFFIHETNGQLGKYVTLSHRWRQDTITVNTTKSNYLCRLNRCGHVDCPQMELSQLFRDAARIAIKLGIKYIWIDSICIIQDDADDWVRESKKMAEYYQFSWLTIVATSINESGGIIRTITEKDMQRVVRLPYRDKSGHQKGYFYAQFSEITIRQEDYENYICCSDILTRGWVYQEWLLSPRILTFSKSALFVQCQTTNPMVISGDLEEIVLPKVANIGFVKPRASINLSSNSPHGARSSVHAKWQSLVESYSKLGITQLTGDRLVALAGIASEYEKAFQNIYKRFNGKEPPDAAANCTRYICGLWYPDIDGLLWEQSNPTSPTRVSGIPTWSWASIANLEPNDARGYIKTGMPVRWVHRLTDDIPEKGFRQLCALMSAKRVPVTQMDDEKWLPDFSKATTISRGTFANEDRFVLLHIRGFLQEVHLDTVFDSEWDAATVAYQTGHDGIQQHLWRRLSLPSLPNTVAGWASVEHPDYQTDAACRSNGPFYAFLTEQFLGPKGSLGLECFLTSCPAYKMLVVRMVNVPGFSDVYERVGVGRLFGREINAVFGGLAERHMRLI